MEYYQCTATDVRLELGRRGLKIKGNIDELCEAIKRDDDTRGTDATTITTEVLGPYMPRSLNLSRTNEFGSSVPATFLVNERIIYWTLNSFYPCLHLFFQSGLSCVIEGRSHPDALVGLDAELRFRLTDCTHEEAGVLTKTIRPDKFASTYPGVLIKEAVIARRRSVAVYITEEVGSPHSRSSQSTAAELGSDDHIVVGLCLEGMQRMGYIWAKARAPNPHTDATWGDVRLAGLRKDVASPSLAVSLKGIKPGGRLVLTTRESLIGKPESEDISGFFESP